MFKLVGRLLAIFLFAGWLNTAHSTPLILDYEITDLGGLFQYDFTLTLDNNDNSWVLGHEWDWIVFGDVPIFETSPLADFGDFVAVDLPIGSSLAGSSGGHNGPTIAVAGSGVLPPGWKPSAIGDSIAWQGTSASFLPQGDLLWSTLITGAGGGVLANFETAHLISSVPEPATIILLSLGLAALGWSRRKIKTVSR